MKLLGIINVGFDKRDQLLIRFFAFLRCWRKKLEYNERVHQLIIGFKKVCDSVRKEVLYNILNRVCGTHKTSYAYENVFQ
jgi:hypothetical protein